jgi:hypothetical protein
MLTERVSAADVRPGWELCMKPGVPQPRWHVVRFVHRSATHSFVTVHVQGRALPYRLLNSRRILVRHNGS